MARAALALLVVLAACGGNQARARALRAAKDARARGDLVGEVIAMRQACEADRRSKKVCGDSYATDQRALAILRVNAGGACGQVDAQNPPTIITCLDAVKPLRHLFPQDPEGERLADVAGDAFAQRCGEGPLGDFSGALRRVRCVEAGSAEVNTARYQLHAAEARAAAAAVVDGLAAAAEARSRPGALAALHGVSACLTGDAGARARSQDVLRDFAATNAPTLVVRSTGITPAELCAETVGVLGGLRCVERPDSRAIVAEATIDLAGIQHDVGERSRTEKYLASIDRTENPAYRTRARDEMQTREAARDAEATYRYEQQGCDAADQMLTRAGYCYDCPERAEKEAACRRAEDAKAMWEQREADWQRAKSEFDSTPAILEHENWKQTSFIVRDHTWQAPWKAELRALPGKAVQRQGAASTTDTEHPGSDLAEIAADPLTPPARGWYQAQLRAQVAAELAELIKAELSARVHSLREKCPGGEPRWTDPAWLDCWSATAIVAGLSDLGKNLIEWESKADAQRTGVALPAPACR
jgi:hypothetical protein